MLDPLFQIADAVVADLESVRESFGTAFTLDRDYLPTWDLRGEKEAENRKPKVLVSPIADEGEDESRGSYRHEGTIFITVGAYVGSEKGHADVIVKLAGDIAKRYRAHSTPPMRVLIYDTNQQAIILNVTRPAIFDVEQLRSFGTLLSGVQLTVRFDEEI
jgi:hypothetical protein